MEDFLKSFDQGGAVPRGKMGATVANAYHEILKTSARHHKKNQITFQDFCLFHLLMARPDPEVDIAFMIMDLHGTGTITREDFEGYLDTLDFYFDPHSEFVERHFGHGQTIRAHHFSQFLAELQKEMGRQAFLYEVQKLDQHPGYLAPKEFIELLDTVCGRTLEKGVVERLKSLYTQESIVETDSDTTKKDVLAVKTAEPSTQGVIQTTRNNLGAEHFAYVDFIAFQDVLLQLPAICSLVERACEINNGPVSPDDLKVANRVLGIAGQLSRQQVDIIFRLFDLDQDGYISFDDALKVCGDSVGSKMLDPVEGRDGRQTFAPPPNYPKPGGSSSRASEGKLSSFEGRWPRYLKHFACSFIAGGIAVLTVYPLDLTKTRMMNQRATASNGLPRIYATSLDCLQKTLQYEGFTGLYRGIYPPLLAAGPELFIKATINKLILSAVSRDLPPEYAMHAEIVSGACAGATQLLITNPLEVTKIRLQMQGETNRIFKEKGFAVPKGLGLHYAPFTEVMKELGVSGLYKGASACLLRDVPFGAIYFPTYTAFKEILGRDDYKEMKSLEIVPLLSGALAAVPASVVTSPFDFLKTRLQVAPRPGEATYAGIFDCIHKVYEKEGPSAFFKGVVPRTGRSCQMGIAMYLYEKLDVRK